MLMTGLLVSQLAFTACASEQYTFHSFSFRAISESPDIEVLDYQYGAKGEYERGGAVGLRPPQYRVERGEVFTGVGVAGNLPKGDFLYVKWRIKETGQIYEDKVDLNTRVPKDITQYGIHFVIVKTQLFVYLIPSPGVFPSLPYAKMRRSGEYAEYFKKHQIYPDQMADTFK